MKCEAFMLPRPVRFHYIRVELHLGMGFLEGMF